MTTVNSRFKVALLIVQKAPAIGRRRWPGKVRLMDCLVMLPCQLIATFGQGNQCKGSADWQPAVSRIGNPLARHRFKRAVAPPIANS